MYSAEIRDEMNYVESAILCAAVHEVAVFYAEHGVNYLLAKMTQYATGNIIAKYTYKKEG